MLIARCRFLGVTIVAVLVLLPGCRRDPAEAAKAHIDRGEQLLAAGQYQAASVEFRNAIELDGTIGVARFGLAKAYANMNEVARARAEFVRAADLMPTDVAVQVAAAQALLRSGEFQDARARAIKAVELDPKNLAAYLVMGSAAAGVRDFETALKSFQDGLSNNPSRPELLVNLGAVQVRRGQQSDAEGYFKQAVVVSPESVTARLALANYYSSAGRMAEAEASIMEAVKIDQTGVAANGALAALLMSTGRTADAEKPLRAIAESSSDPAHKLRLADFYVGQQRGREAETILRELAKIPEVFAAATSRLAAIDYQSGRPERAYALVDEVLQKHPANAEVLVVKSRWLLADGQFDQAQIVAETALKAEPNYWSAHEALGAARAAKRDAAGAITAYTEATRLNPSATLALIALADLNQADGKPEHAIRFAEDAVRTAPASGMARMTLVRALLAQGDVTRARTELQPLLASAPTHPAVQTLLGQVEARVGNSQVARAAFERAGLSADTSAIVGLLRLDLAAKDHQKALARIEEYVARAPKDPRGYYLAGRTHAGIGNVDQAVRATQRAIELDPDYMEAYALLGQLYVRQKKLPDARAEYQRLIERRPTNVSAMTMVGMLFQAEGNHAEARKIYERVLGVDSRAVVAANNLAYMLALENTNLDRALDLAQTAKAARPDDPDVNDTLGWVYYQRNLPAMAIAPLEQSVNADPRNATYQFHLGLAYWKAGQKGKARAALERALELNPNFDGAAEARRALSEIQG